MIALVLLVLLTGCTTTITGTAAPIPAPDLAATPEQNFRYNLELHDLTTGSDESDQRLGAKVCFHWERTTDTFATVYPTMTQLTGLDGRDTALFIVVATTQLCPEQMSKIPER